MFGIEYDHWRLTCEAYQNATTRRRESYLQLYPLSKITDEGWEQLKSKDFFETYISTGSFVNFPQAMFHTKHFIQKDDGSFRDAELLSPVLFLILQALGVELSGLYHDGRPYNNSCYYAGNFDEKGFFYKAEYDKFYKELNGCIDSFQYFIKTDTTSFFSNIDVNRLVHKLDERINLDSTKLTPIQLNAIKEFLYYCGSGSFPLIESSAASSFLATVVYLDPIDVDLTRFIETTVSCVDSIRLVRYVDDLYILLQCPDNIDYSVVHEASIEIRNKYSSLLKSEGLSLNTKKYAFRETRDICEDLKKSLYDEHYKETITEIEAYFPNALKDFLAAILKKLDNDCIDFDQYNQMIQEYFCRDDIEFTAEEVFNYLVYGVKSISNAEDVASTIAKIVWKDVSIISLDAKRLLPLLIKVKSDNAVKKVLNRLFERHRQSIWNSNDTTIAIAYLLHSGFKHIDLLGVVSSEAPELYKYYKRYCSNRFSLIAGEKYRLRCLAIGNDWITNYLYFMYIARSENSNAFEAFAFYKSFFDRITTDIAYAVGIEKKKSNYEKYYRKKNLKAFYSSISKAETTIEQAHKLRNMNPINHASSGVIEDSERMTELSSCTNNMEEIINRFLADMGNMV